MNIGDKIFVNDSIGEVVVLDIKKDYLVLLREGGRYVKANKYYYENEKLSWEHGAYYNNLDDLIKALEG